MKGFVIDSLRVEMSDELCDKIDGSRHGDGSKLIDGQKYKRATARIEFISTGCVSDISEEHLLDKLNSILPLIVKINT